MGSSDIPSEEVQRLHLEVALSLGEQLRVVVEMLDHRTAPVIEGVSEIRAGLAAVRAEIVALRDIDSRHDEALKSGAWLTEDGCGARCKLGEVRAELKRLQEALQSAERAVGAVEAKVTPVYRIAIALGVAWAALVSLLLFLTALGKLAGTLGDIL